HILERERAELVLEVASLSHLCDARTEKSRNGNGQTFGQSLQRGVALRVHTRVVQRIRGLGNSQKARGLLEYLLRKAGHFQKSGARSEKAARRSVLDDRAREPGTHA